MKDIENVCALPDGWREPFSEEKRKGKAMSAITCIAAFALLVACAIVLAACAAVKGALWILK